MLASAVFLCNFISTQRLHSNKVESSFWIFLQKQKMWRCGEHFYSETLSEYFLELSFGSFQLHVFCGMSQPSLNIIVWKKTKLLLLLLYVCIPFSLCEPALQYSLTFLYSLQQLSSNISLYLSPSIFINSYQSDWPSWRKWFHAATITVLHCRDGILRV